MQDIAVSADEDGLAALHPVDPCVLRGKAAQRTTHLAVRRARLHHGDGKSLVLPCLLIHKVCLVLVDTIICPWGERVTLPNGHALKALAISAHRGRRDEMLHPAKRLNAHAGIFRGKAGHLKRSVRLQCLHGLDILLRIAAVASDILHLRAMDRRRLPVICDHLMATLQKFAHDVGANVAVCTSHNYFHVFALLFVCHCMSKQLVRTRMELGRASTKYR